MALFAQYQRLASSGKHVALPERFACEILQLSDVVDFYSPLARSTPFTFLGTQTLSQFGSGAIAPFARDTVKARVE